MIGKLIAEVKTELEEVIEERFAVIHGSGEYHRLRIKIAALRGVLSYLSEKELTRK